MTFVPTLELEEYLEKISIQAEILDSQDRVKSFKDGEIELKSIAFVQDKFHQSQGRLK